ncbi:MULTISPECIES: DUF6234 family protein [unclassified Streptomyces]|uniref:DUF6234 family protein n=1 Tax=unclassified Streptomyces TaxID=2593676 RepID=UPI00224DB3B6|nr:MULTISPECIES: DUF6234 family protein [unclassified Streptomyces]MCX4788754.1 DUF6234 family protein [Streptomyces sp. NBC_01221]MCX4795498.1 DUF6234 family protein [Streptomyces sp. NBC_01242]WSP56965.1 DUF6234 family protein [Streptomyces sp. NBC_01241]WSP63209.1 DUF6234 family protein [Streptomyces sp. NBC_01240]
MTESPYRHSDSRDSRPRRGSRAVNGCLDVVLGLLLVLLEGLICAAAAHSLTLSRSRWDPGASETTDPPPMDWTPVLVFGGIAAAVALIAVVLIRENWPWAGALQIPVVLLLCVAAVQVGHEDYRRSHPAPASTPSDDPGRSGHQCLSGGDNHACLDSGG